MTAMKISVFAIDFVVVSVVVRIFVVIDLR